MTAVTAHRVRKRLRDFAPMVAIQGSSNRPAGEDFAEQHTEVLIEPGDHYIVNPRSAVVLVARATLRALPARVRVRMRPAADCV